jgi:hypothetical protein
MAVAAPARKLAPATAPARRAPARAAPQRSRPKPKRDPAGRLIPIAVGRTAGAVRHLPDSSLMVRMTRGRTWIGVLGVLLVGIVALNVVTLSFAASSGHIEQNIQALEQENPLLNARAARLTGAPRIHSEAAEQGLVMPSADLTTVIHAGPEDVADAARRLAAAGAG